MTQLALPLFSRSLLLVLALACSFMELVAQRTTIVLSQEIKVPAGVKISSAGPRAVQINGRGIINSRHLKDKYVVSGKKALPHVFAINKAMSVNSWQQNTIKQVVTLVIETENGQQLADIQRAIHPDLTLSPTNEVRLNYELNIAQFTLNNGWFQKDNNSITLSNGNVYPIKYLEIKNEVFLPEDATLNFNLERTNFSLNDHQGSIELAMEGGSCSTGCLNQLNATVTDASLQVDAIEKANIKAVNSQLKLGDVNELKLTSSLSNGHINSTQRLSLEESLSDNLTFHNVRAGTIHKAVFSSLVVASLKQGLMYSGKGSHLQILRAEPSLQSFLADSQDGSVKFPLSDLPSAHLECSNTKSNRFILPTSITKPEQAAANYNFHWGDPATTVSVKLRGSRCEFHLGTQ